MKYPLPLARLCWAGLYLPTLLAPAAWAEVSIEPESPGPLVEVTLQDSSKIKGYMLKLQNGHLQLKLLEGLDRKELKAEEIGTLQFVAPETPKLKTTTENQTSPPPKLESESTGNSDPAGQENRFKPNRRDYRILLDQMLKNLISRIESDRPMEYGRQGPLNPALRDRTEWIRIRKKMDFPEPTPSYLKMFADANTDAQSAKRNGQLDEYLEKHRKDLKQAAVAEDFQRQVASLCNGYFYGQSTPSEIQGKIDADVTAARDALNLAQEREDAQKVFMDFLFFHVVEAKHERLGPGGMRRPLDKRPLDTQN